MFFGRYGLFYNKSDFIFCMVVIVPLFLISILISAILRRVYDKYSKINTKNKISGAVVARNILDGYGLNHVRVEKVEGKLSDHFDPISNVVRLSYLNYEGFSISSIGVAAHEVGHAVQHQQKYFPIRVRSLVVSISNFGSKIFLPLLIGSLLIRSSKFVFIWLILLILTTLLEFVTLPVEFDASNRAVKILRSQKILTQEEVEGVKKVLCAAALTYVVSFASSVAQLVRLILAISSLKNNDDD